MSHEDTQVNASVLEEGLDADGKAILDELQAEGFDIAGRAPKNDDSQVVTPPATEPKKEEQPANPEPPKEDQQQPPADSDKSDEGKKNDSRIATHVPLIKLTKEEEKRKEAESKAAQLEKELAEERAKNANRANEAVRSELVQEYLDMGLSQEDAEKAADAAAKKLPATQQQDLPEDVKAKLAEHDALKKRAEEADIIRQQDARFDDDFSNTILKEFPQLVEHKQKIHDIAFTEGNESIPLRALVIQYMHDTGAGTSKQSAESTSQGTQNGAETIDFDNVTEEQYAKMSPEMQEKFDQHMINKERRAQGHIVR